ncbi:MAG: porin [Leptospira sp.]|nr:porin [Leptospira sp.]
MNKNKFNFSISCLIVIIVFPITIFAEANTLDSEIQASENVISEKQSKSMIPKPDLTVFLDTYHANSSVRFVEGTRPYVTQSLNTNEFAINHALVNLEAENDKLRYALGVHTGTYVQANYSEEPDQFQYIYQGWVGISLLNNVWLDMGIFPSHIGGESAISFDNFNYTRSLVAENSPYYEAGARLVWDISSHLTARLYALNGWQQIRNQNRDLAGGLQLEYKFLDNWTFNFSNFVGNEAPSNEKRQTRYFQNLFIKGKIFNWLETYWIYDIGFQKKNTPSWPIGLEDYHIWQNKNNPNGFHRWEGFSIQFYFHLSERWKLGIRGEGYYDPNEKIVKTASRNGYQVESGSVNIDYLPIDMAMLRFEIKTNAAIDPIFRDEFNATFRRENLAVVNLSIKYN